MNSNYYLTLPIKVVNDKNLTPFEIILLSNIHSLSRKLEYCYATNHYLANIHKVTTRTITKYLSLLTKKGYINCEYIKTETNITKRKIYITDMEVWNALSRGIENLSNNGVEDTLYQNKELNNKKYNNYSNKINKFKKQGIVPDWFDKKIELIPATKEEIAEMEELLRPFKDKE